MKGISVETLDNFQQGNKTFILLLDDQIIIPDTYNLEWEAEWRKRRDAVSSITDMKKYIPWFLDCNRQRYPYWFGKLDPRNKLLFEALKKYFGPGFGSN